MFLFLIYFLSNPPTGIFTNFKKKSVGRVQSHLKFKVALKSTYIISLKFVKMFVLSRRQKYIKNKNFHRVVLKLLASKGQK